MGKQRQEITGELEDPLDITIRKPRKSMPRRASYLRSSRDMTRNKASNNESSLRRQSCDFVESSKSDRGTADKKMRSVNISSSFFKSDKSSETTTHSLNLKCSAPGWINKLEVEMSNPCVA